MGSCFCCQCKEEESIPYERIPLTENNTSIGYSNNSQVVSNNRSCKLLYTLQLESSRTEEFVRVVYSSHCQLSSLTSSKSSMIQFGCLRATLTQPHGYIDIWHEQTRLYTIVQRDVREIAFSPDTHWLATVQDSMISLWDVVPLLHSMPYNESDGSESDDEHERHQHHSLECTKQLVLDEYDDGSIICIDWSGDGLWLACGTDSGLIYIWNRTAGTLVAKLDGRGLVASEQIDHIVFSPDSSVLASSGIAGTIQIWRCCNWKYERTLTTQHRSRSTHCQGVSIAVRQLVFCHSGSLLAAVINDNNVYTWECQQWRQYSMIALSVPAHLCFSPDDSKLIMATGKRIRIFSINNWQLIDHFKTPYKVIDAAFRPNGSELALVCESGLFIAWEVHDTRSCMLAIYPARARNLQLCESDDKDVPCALIDSFFCSPILDVSVLRIIRQFIGDGSLGAPQEFFSDSESDSESETAATVRSF
jgi:WD40 repeat protein